MRHRKAEDFLSSDEQANLPELLEQQVSLENKVKKPKKKPASSSGVEKVAEKKTSEVAKKTKQKAQKGKVACPKQSAKQSKKKKAPKNNEQGEPKCTFKHRKTSTAYSAARKAAEKAGETQEQAKEIGRAALRKMSADIDAGLVKEH